MLPMGDLMPSKCGFSSPRILIFNSSWWNWEKGLGLITTAFHMTQRLHKMIHVRIRENEILWKNITKGTPLASFWERYFLCLIVSQILFLGLLGMENTGAGSPGPYGNLITTYLPLYTLGDENPVWLDCQNPNLPGNLNPRRPNPTVTKI